MFELSFLYAAFLGYILGSIPFGLVLIKATGGGDIRDIGSGSIGATNVLRTGKKGFAVATLVLDAGKAVVAIILARYFWGEAAAMIAGFTAFLGHLFPVWLGFKGGKGVATMIGVLLALAWPVGIAFCLVWLITAFMRKQSSVAGITAAATAPVFSWFMVGGALSITALALALLLIYRHHENIKRLIAGTEPRIGSSKS